LNVGRDMAKKLRLVLKCSQRFLTPSFETSVILLQAMLVTRKDSVCGTGLELGQTGGHLFSQVQAAF